MAIQFLTDVNADSGTLYVDSINNRVGIGTTSPSSRLEVNGEIDANGGDGYRIETKPWANWGSDLLTLGDWDGEGYATRIMGSNSSEVMRVTGNNVGIGETSPAYKLEVNGTLGVSRTDGIIFAGSAGPGQGNKITSDTSNNLIFSTSLISAPYTTAEKVRILNNGNVGIGTTNPGAKLEVNGDSRFVGSMQLYSGSTSNLYLIILQSYNSTFISTGTSGETIYIGAPTTNQSNLQVQGDFIVRGGSSSTSIQTQTTANVVTNKIVDSGISYFNAGNVGIGTTNPGEKLEVNGSVKATATTDAYKGYVKSFQSGGFYHSSSSNSSVVYWIPTNYFNEVTSSQYYNNWIAPYSGRVKKIVMRWASGTTPTATSVTFRYAVNASTSLSTFPATVTNGASTNMAATKVFNDTDIIFNTGDRVQLGFTTNGGTRLLYGFAYTIVLEYNIT